MVIIFKYNKLKFTLIFTLKAVLFIDKNNGA